jgi:hypothetical protein
MAEETQKKERERRRRRRRRRRLLQCGHLRRHVAVHVILPRGDGPRHSATWRLSTSSGHVRSGRGEGHLDKGSFTPGRIEKKAEQEARQLDEKLNWVDQRFYDSIRFFARFC